MDRRDPNNSERRVLADGGVSNGEGGRKRYLDGKLHRDDGPAWITRDGLVIWFCNGLQHRTGGPAVMRPDGALEWYLHGQRHRADGPAIIKSGRREQEQAWWLNGQRHRLDGPAITTESTRGKPNERWYVNGHDIRTTPPIGGRRATGSGRCSV
jgi:hypothetical protein